MNYVQGVIMSYPYIDEKYIKLVGMYTNRFREVGNGTYNCRCIFCGDSAKSEYKARGYFYLNDNNNWRYKCHNCAINITVGAFIREASLQLYQEYRYEYFLETKPKNIRKKEEKKDIEYKSENIKLKLLSNKILSMIIPLCDLDEDNPGYKYIKDRNIPESRMERLYYIENLKEVASHIEEYDAEKIPEISGIAIPYFNDDGILTSFQLRNIDPTSNMRYLTYDLTPDANHIYNLENISCEEPVYVFEGAFDSMFCNNAVAASGASIFQKLSIIKEKNDNVVIVFDNDYKTNKEIRKLLTNIINKNYPVVLYDSSMDNFKDINEFVNKTKMNVDQVTSYLKKCTCTQLDAKFQLAQTSGKKRNDLWLNQTTKTKKSKTKIYSKDNSPFTI
jgi:hypothetical protein